VATAVDATDGVTTGEEGGGTGEEEGEGGGVAEAKKKKKKKKAKGAGVVSKSLGVTGFCDSYTRSNYLLMLLYNIRLGTPYRAPPLCAALLGKRFHSVGKNRVTI